AQRSHPVIVDGAQKAHVIAVQLVKAQSGQIEEAAEVVVGGARRVAPIRCAEASAEVQPPVFADRERLQELGLAARDVGLAAHARDALEELRVDPKAGARKDRIVEAGAAQASADTTLVELYRRRKVADRHLAVGAVVRVLRSDPQLAELA